MITVYKYPFNIADHVEINLRKGAQILKVETQGLQPCMWALVDTDKPVEPRGYYIFGTGHSMDVGMAMVGKHVATFQQGAFVWHMFENGLNPI